MALGIPHLKEGGGDGDVYRAIRWRQRAWKSQYFWNQHWGFETREAR
jgi:hypothetical protein